MTEHTEQSDRPDCISRRGFVSLAGLTGVGIVVPKWAIAEQRAGSGAAKSTAAPHEEEDVARPEDLMREHGVLKRVLLIYDEAIRRIDAKQPLSPDPIRQFNRMYAPHEAREDTVLFPALRSIVSRNEFAALGEDFEKKEHQLFGEEGFEKMGDRVASIEKALGIYDLAQFTPHA